MKLRRLNNALHRDLGYILVGTAVLYALSGLALNHRDDWNPNFVIHRQDMQASVPDNLDSVTRTWVLGLLESLGEQAHYRSHDFPTPEKLKIYLDEGSVLIDMATGKGVFESVKRRPVFYQINCLHLNPDRTWLVFSDLFAVLLVIVSITGVFVLKGRKGITGRGTVLVAAGILVPLLFLFSV